ncbi:type III pantothenate kinase [Pseudoxanthomonas sp. F37]|jgi:type III pantothenate kinase|uniref:type III pantothenate kinase n=1 Tax=Pseudoxanthomonas TaxID=83618 RepID=UPI001FD30D0C|nr:MULTISPECIES: type III pantothenate kinase [Pseudoxanthomonas]UOV06666.1 type III pantothenate kinase [Pseudoxanthomonas mexicana]UOV08276.1 type III pantothenate kinase [Pseudoxanthomonas sp. F37]
MTQWVFDVGNSRLKAAPVHADGSLGEGLAIPHDEVDVAAALDAALPQTITRTASAALASVASAARTAAVVDALTRRFGCISIARTQPALAGVRIAYADPSRLGVDRFLALLAARARAVQAWLVVGVGTAVTVDLLDADGLHRGGRIAPSPTLMRAALERAAAQLPAQGGRYAEFATDTRDALASGCDGAALGLIERSRAQARDLLGAMPALLLHGGGSDALRPWLPDAVHAPALVLEGLARWARAGIDG